MKTQIKTLSVCLMIVIGLLSCKEKAVEPDVLRIVGLTEKVNGIGYAELNVADMKRSLELPADKTNPYVDETGEASATAKQTVNGFTILTSNFGGKSVRTVTIPASNYVYLSPIGTVFWYYENDKCDPDTKPKAGQSVKDFLYAELAKYVDLDKATASVKLDGTELISEKTKFRFKSEVFESNIHNDFNSLPCDYTGQKAKLISDGYNILMKIPKGKHTLVMKGIIPDADPANVFEAEVTWNITVE